jgi:hypothetical protein
MTPNQQENGGMDGTWFQDNAVWIAAAFCAVVVGISALGFASPAGFVSVVRRIHSRGGIIGMGLFRVGLGLSLYFAARESLRPPLLRILGVAIVIVGLISLFASVQRFSRTIDWWAAKGPIFQRAWCAIGLFGGLALIYLLLADRLLGGA